MAKQTNRIENIMNLVQRHPDWRSSLEKRQHKFVQNLLENDGDIITVANHFYFTKDDMLSIFEKIERKLISFDEWKQSQKKSTQKSVTLLGMEELLKQQKETAKIEEERLREVARKEREQKRIEEERKRKEEEERIRVLARLEEERKKKEAEERAKELARLEEERKQAAMLENLDENSKYVIKTVLSESQNINVHEVYPKRLAEYIESIMMTMDLEKSAEMMGVGKQYLISRITGRKKPRKPCEKGALHYLHQHSESA